MRTASIYMWGTQRHRLQRKDGQGADAGCAAGQLASGFRSRGCLEGGQVRHQPAGFAGGNAARRATATWARIRIRKAPDDLAQAEAVLLKIRPYIRNISSSEYIEALANGDLCISVGYNGDVMQARDRAREANKGIDDQVCGAQGRLDSLVRHAGDPEGRPGSGQRLRLHELHDDAAGHGRGLQFQALCERATRRRSRWCCPPSRTIQASTRRPKSARRNSRCSWPDSPEQTRAITADRGKNSRRANKT